jgi:hypothetical protein
MISYCSAAIAWRKKSFRKYFDKEENFIKFHQLLARSMEAPTESMASLIQDEIIVWLNDVGEKGAARWFEKTWTGEHGNYTNASAGYVATNKASGIEKNWKTIKEATIGSAGANMSMSLGVFAPALIKHIKDASEKHADKILCPKTGQHMFPNVPTIPPALWKAVQEFNLLRVRLAYVEQSAASRLEWQRVADFFGQDDPDGPQLSFIEKLMSFRAAGHTVGIARTNIGGILMPTDDLLTYLKRKQGCDTFRKLSDCVSDLVPQYKLLFHDPDAFMDANPGMPVEEILNIMDSFVRYTSNMSMPQATL